MRDRAAHIHAARVYICGKKAEAHHPDYRSPLDVVWLCPAHHAETHKLGRELTSAPCF